MIKTEPSKLHNLYERLKRVRVQVSHGADVYTTLHVAQLAVCGFQEKLELARVIPDDKKSPDKIEPQEKSQPQQFS